MRAQQTIANSQLPLGHRYGDIKIGKRGIELGEHNIYRKSLGTWRKSLGSHDVTDMTGDEIPEANFKSLLGDAEIPR